MFNGSFLQNLLDSKFGAEKPFKDFQCIFISFHKIKIFAVLYLVSHPLLIRSSSSSNSYFKLSEYQFGK